MSMSQDEMAEEALAQCYFQKIAEAARLLSTSPDGMDIIEEVPNSSDSKLLLAQQYVDLIARHLLAACDPSLMSKSCGNLPPKVYVQSKHDIVVSSDCEDNTTDDSDKEYRNYLYCTRRIDYLRLLLRAMAPCSMDVAALCCSSVQSMLVGTNGSMDTETTRQAIFILFSVWLPVAPHLAPLVSGLFSLSSFPCPLVVVTPTTNHEQHVWTLAEAAHRIWHFYVRQLRQQEILLNWWNWSPLFGWIRSSSTDDSCDTIMRDGSGGSSDDDVDHQPRAFLPTQAMHWHAVRAAAFVLNLAPATKAQYLKRHGVEKEIVPWVMHPWEMDHEDCRQESMYLSSRASFWTTRQEDEFDMPTADIVRRHVPLHPFLVEVGAGLTFVKRNCIRDSREMGGDEMDRSRQQLRLVRTATTSENLTRLGVALCREMSPPPILLIGPTGSGKTSLVREACRLFGNIQHDSLLEIHVDEETDTKTLVGSYTATDIPGEFEWRPGALTLAVRAGLWVLMEDMDTVPMEIQASLVQLLKERLLPLGNGKVERCHPDFRLFGTLTAQSKGSSTGRWLMNPSYWHHINVEPLPLSELKAIAVGRHSGLPEAIVDSALAVFRSMDQSGRTATHEDNTKVAQLNNRWIGREVSVRDLFKLFARIEATVAFEKYATYATESQRTLCLAEAVDVFIAACPDSETRREFVRKIAAPSWGVSADLASRYVDTRGPTVQLHSISTEVGRATIPVSDSQAGKRMKSESFAETSYALRLVEQIAVCVRQNESALLVGETGTGKTSILQHLAKLAGRELIVQNLSLQTDSTDLLGGYRPLEMQHVARRVYQTFVDLFTSTFSRKQNAEFLSLASTSMQKRNWKRLSQLFRRAAQMGLNKVKERNNTGNASSSVVTCWNEFRATCERFEQQRLACDSGLAFVFAEGALVDAIRRGKWVLLDEINLASTETLQRLSGLLDDATSSLTLTERGDSLAVSRHPEFRLFAAMNPATDSGKKDLNSSIRSRFTEIYVDELLDPVELRVISGRYLAGVLPMGDRPPEHTDIVISVVNTYLEYRHLANTLLVDGSGQRPRYTLRTLTRALVAARNIVLQQKLSLRRALVEGFALAFEGPLDVNSLKATMKVAVALSEGLTKKEMNHPGRRPVGGNGGAFVLLKPFWVGAGPLAPVDWSERLLEKGISRFILTPSTEANLRRLSRAVASGPWPILLEGPTSAGKTTLVQYLAARCGHNVVRINNHEHTDVQEYTGGFAADSHGSLAFQDGLLVRALRCGDWVILDELNLAPSEVLEALNRLLDDNRELYLPEVNETVKAHPSFRLFATQNPSGAYGGRKPLSRAFRNRFVEIHVNDIPSPEMVTILELRCGCPHSHATQLVSIMDSLRQRRSQSGLFLGKDGFISPRDLLRWAERGSSSKIELARVGFMLLAERLRTDEEKQYVKSEIEKQLKVDIEIESFYYGESSEARLLLEKAQARAAGAGLGDLVKSIAPTRAILRLMTLVLNCIKQREPVLLVGGECTSLICCIEYIEYTF
jgi:midasin